MRLALPLAFIALAACTSTSGPLRNPLPESGALDRSIRKEVAIELDMSSDMSHTEISETAQVRSIAESLLSRRIVEAVILDRNHAEMPVIAMHFSGAYDDHSGENRTKSFFGGLTFGASFLATKFHESVALSASMRVLDGSDVDPPVCTIEEEYHFRSNNLQGWREDRDRWLLEAKEHFGMLCADAIRVMLESGACDA